MTQPTILVVDDKVTNLHLLTTGLEQAGFRTSTARNGENAIAKAQSISVSLILLDVMMPEIDGFEVCRRLKADPKTQCIPVIFMTALNGSDHKVRGFELGAVDYITKPIQIDETLSRIRTHLALRQTQTNLEQLVQQLQQTQTQLVQSEKMAGLGQLVAGVAHEINNPVNFIYGNLTHANDYFRDVLELLNLYQHYYPDPHPTIQVKAQKIDLEFLLEDVPKLLSSIKGGAQRIQEIVQSLRNFSRSDECDVKSVDIHEGLDSALLILQHRLKALPDRPPITVTKQYGVLPPVECYPGQINQVFMNLVVNAIDALECYCPSPDYAGRIEIQTRLQDEQWVCIAIRDNGPGISKAIQPRLFDPFFTTKPVGQGTGLGLSISYNIIVNNHQGWLSCESIPGDSTTFTIKLPVKSATPN